MTGDGTGRTLSVTPKVFTLATTSGFPGKKGPKLPGKVPGKSSSEVAKVFHSRLEGGTVNKASVFHWRRSENRRKLTSGLLHCLWLMVQPSLSSSASSPLTDPQIWFSSSWFSSSSSSYFQVEHPTAPGKTYSPLGGIKRTFEADASRSANKFEFEALQEISQHHTRRGSPSKFPVM